MTTGGFRDRRDDRRARTRDGGGVRAHAVSPPERAAFRAALGTTTRVDFVARGRVWFLTRCGDADHDARRLGRLFLSDLSRLGLHPGEDVLSSD
jgi:hypothetical protein